MTRRRRLRATCLLLLWGAWLVAGAWHAGTASHRYCSVHGSFEDVHAGTANDAPRTPHAVYAGNLVERGHHACAFAATTQAQPRAGVVRLARLLPALVPPPAPAPGHIPAPIRLLDVAPKASPPQLSI